MQTKAEVKIVGKPTKRDILIKCPECKHPNCLTVETNLPAQKGTLECHSCGATLEYKEILEETQ